MEARKLLVREAREMIRRAKKIEVLVGVDDDNITALEVTPKQALALLKGWPTTAELRGGRGHYWSYWAEDDRLVIG